MHTGLKTSADAKGALTQIAIVSFSTNHIHTSSENLKAFSRRQLLFPFSHCTHIIITLWIHTHQRVTLQYTCQKPSYTESRCSSFFLSTAHVCIVPNMYIMVCVLEHTVSFTRVTQAQFFLSQHCTYMHGLAYRHVLEHTWCKTHAKSTLTDITLSTTKCIHAPNILCYISPSMTYRYKLWLLIHAS